MDNLTKAFIFLSVLLLAGCRAKSDTNIDRPNVLLILADDMGFSDIGCYGSEIQTPNLDFLAEQGIRFNQFYNAARCCPTRASLLTGLYPHQVGMGGMVAHSGGSRPDGPYQGYLRKDSCQTLAELLGSSGYRCYMSGKWHVGEYPDSWPQQRGFDRYWGLISGASSYWELIKAQPRDRVMVSGNKRWDPPSEGFYMTDATTQEAILQLKDHFQNHGKQPFFSYVAYTAPHWPLHAWPEDIQKYKGFYDKGWDSLRLARYEKQKELGLFDSMPTLSQRTQEIMVWSDVKDKRFWTERMEVYAAMVDRMDQGIGKLIQLLREENQLDNTIVMFLSDNGGCAEEITGRRLNDSTIAVGAQGSYVAYREPWANASNTPFRYYKQWTHEGGIRTPFILHYPNADLPKNSITSQVGHIVDIVPTCLASAGVPYPDALLPLTGKDLFNLLDQDDSTPRSLFWEHMNNRSFRKDQFKIVKGRSQEWQLYNVQDDPTETRNLAEAQPELRDRMIVEWTNWAHKVGVNLNE